MIDSNESMTAKFCSYARAHHSICMRDKIFNDFLAYEIMGEDEYKRVEGIIQKTVSHTTPVDFINKYICPILLPRIAYAESKLCAFLQRFKKIQYVILGAGMDTFAFRNGNSDIEIFELDHPSTQRYKLERIEQSNWEIPLNLHFISIDFEKENIKDVLINSGFDIDKPTFFSLLGVTYYLNLEAFEKMLDDISELLNNESQFIFDFPDETTFESKRSKFLADITASLGEPMKKGFKYKEFENLFKEHNFKIENHLSPADIQKIYFENRSNSLKAFENVHLITIKKERK